MKFSILPRNRYLIKIILSCRMAHVFASLVISEIVARISARMDITVMTVKRSAAVILVWSVTMSTENVFATAPRDGLESYVIEVRILTENNLSKDADLIFGIKPTILLRSWNDSFP